MGEGVKFLFSNVMNLCFNELEEHFCSAAVAYRLSKRQTPTISYQLILFSL